MIKKNISAILLISFCFMLAFMAGNLRVSDSKCKIVVKKKTVIKKIYVDTCNIYEFAINHLKKYEGFRSEIYLGNNGKKTVGYGHQLLKGENHNNIDEQTATEILKNDFNKHLNYVEEKYKLSGRKCIALALFSFNVGQGKLDKAVSNGLLENINKLTLYSKFKQGGIYKNSKKLLERRSLELHLFKN